MTVSNTMTNMYTLAHELGHGFHNKVLFDLYESAQDARMEVAETASTMAEIIVTQDARRSEKDPKERRFLIEDHLERAAAYLMNMYARVLYETRFYAKWDSFQMKNLQSEEAQKEGYGKARETYHPLFWAAKRPVFFTDVPFYNLTYTFEYLFSLGIYKHALEKGDFENSYVAILRDTGRITVESLGEKHLQMEFADFWRDGLSIIKKYIETYVSPRVDMPRPSFAGAVHISPSQRSWEGGRPRLNIFEAGRISRSNCIIRACRNDYTFFN